MDTRYFGTNLLTINEVRGDGRRVSTETAEDAYYKRHAPAPAKSGVPGIVSLVVAVCVGFATVGLWPH